LDANLTYDDVQWAAVGYCYGDSTSGQRTLYQLGLTQIPVVNVNNNVRLKMHHYTTLAAEH